MTALEMRQEAERDFATQARHDRAELAQALAALTAQANVMLETSMLVEHAAQMREGVDFKVDRAAVTLVGTARRETQRCLERVARACGVRL